MADGDRTTRSWSIVIQTTTNKAGMILTSRFSLKGIRSRTLALLYHVFALRDTHSTPVIF